RAAGGGHDDDGQRLVDAELDGPRELLADHRAHAAAEESELEHAEHRRKAAHARDAADDGILEARLLPGGAHAIRIALGVPEAQRIAGGQTGLVLLERAGIGEHRDALARADPER